MGVFSEVEDGKFLQIAFYKVAQRKENEILKIHFSREMDLNNVRVCRNKPANIWHSVGLFSKVGQIHRLRKSPSWPKYTDYANQTMVGLVCRKIARKHMAFYGGILKS